MNKCFVIQPFNKTYNKRFKDVYKSAIEAAELEPYRVDQDPSTRIPISSIENGIKDSVICFADVTENNPNVWYELGFAFAAGKDVVMICADERNDKFPFDIQHRSIINYSTSSPSDFDVLKKEITKKLQAFLSKEKKVQRISDSIIKETEGLSNHEITLLAIIMEDQAVPDTDVSVYGLTDDMQKAGFNKLATSMALRELEFKNMVELYQAQSSYNYDEFPACRLTDNGVQWLMENKDKFKFEIDKNSQDQSDLKNIGENDLPF